MDEIKEILMKDLVGTYIKEHNVCWKPLEALKGIEQPPKWHPEGDAYIHTILVLDRASRLKFSASKPFEFVLACLCHDFGKAVTTTKDETGRIKSYGHDIAGISIAENWLNDFGFSQDTIKYVKNMVRLHMRVHQLGNDKCSVKATNKLLDISECMNDLILLSLADSNLNDDEFKELNEFWNERTEIYLNQRR